MVRRRLSAALAALAMVVAPATAAHAQKVKYGKTELDRAKGKCVGSVLGGALLGALVGRAVGGKDSTLVGAAVGATAGAGVCAVLISNAKHKDKMLAAQLAAAQNPGQLYEATWTNDEGQPVTFSSQASTASLDGTRLMPIKYELNGTKYESPVLPAGPQDCRSASGTFGDGSNMPAQTVCRTPDGDYQPYGLKTA